MDRETDNRDAIYIYNGDGEQIMQSTEGITPKMLEIWIDDGRAVVIKYFRHGNVDQYNSYGHYISSIPC